MSAEHPRTASLGKALLDSGFELDSITPDDDPPDLFELQFRKEVAQLIQAILHRNYVEMPEVCAKEAHQRGLTTEQLIAAVVAHRVMKKVDEEYL